MTDLSASIEIQSFRCTYHLFQVTVNIGDQFDWEILKNVHRTAHRSKKIASDLHHLKGKIYGLENELKHL